MMAAEEGQTPDPKRTDTGEKRIVRNWSGAFPGGPPQISVEEARKMVEDPEAVRQAYLERLKARRKELGD